MTSSLVSWPLARRTVAHLAEGALGLADGFLRAVDLDGVPARDDAHAEGVAEQLQELVAVAEEEDGLVAAVEGEGARNGVWHSGCRGSPDRGRTPVTAGEFSHFRRMAVGTRPSQKKGRPGTPWTTPKLLGKSWCPM